MNTQQTVVTHEEALEGLPRISLNGGTARLTPRQMTYGRRELLREDGTDRCVLTPRQMGELIHRAGQWWTKDNGGRP